MNRSARLRWERGGALERTLTSLNVAGFLRHWSATDGGASRCRANWERWMRDETQCAEHLSE